MIKDTQNPYVGLRPFDTEESLLFFGRNEQTLELLDRLHKHHFVAVVGSSGSGKSSLLRAGLIPALKAGYLVDDSDHWCIAIMKPGQSPLYNLADSLLNQVNQKVEEDTIKALVAQIEEKGVDAILNLITPLWKEKNTNFFLLVDQFEELFRFSMEHNDRNKKDNAIDFVNIILELSTQAIIPFYIVLTMRSDFIGDCSDFHGLPEAMNKSQYLVPRLNRQKLKIVIEGPAKLYGRKVNPSLTSKLLNELGKVKDELPLLQHALMRMWDYETSIDKDGEIDLKDYVAIGGIEKALSKHADEALKDMSKEEFQIAKELFQALTTVDEHGRKTRRPVLLNYLQSLTGVKKEKLLKVIHNFIEDKRSFLIINEVADSDDTIIDISHESLIRQWKRLGRWVDEEGDAAAHYFKLTQDFLLYQDNKKDHLEGTELEIASNWYHSFNPKVEWAKRYNDHFEECVAYLRKSEEIRDINLEAERKRKRKRRNARRIGIGLASGVLLIAAIFLSIFYGVKKQQNDTVETTMQEANKLYATAVSLDKEDDVNALSGYFEVISFIEAQKDLYKSEKKVDSLGEIQYNQEKDTLLKVAQDLRIEVITNITKIEEKMDSENWKNAKAVNSSESYTEYLKIVNTYAYFKVNEDNIRAANEALKGFDQDPLWIAASTENTVTSYLEYIHDLMAEDLSEDDLSKRIDTVTSRIIDVRRTGWLFAGRTTGADRVFDIVYNIYGDSTDGFIPKKGDIVKARSYRSTYKDFTGNAVINRKGAPMKQNDLAIVQEQKKVGEAIFLQIAY